MKSRIDVGARSPFASFVHLRGALLAALGLSITACGGTVVGGSGGGGAGGGTSASACKNPQPILQPSGHDTGFVMCEGGAIDRVAKVTCDPTTSPWPSTCGTPGDPNGYCNAATDCKDAPGGYCLNEASGCHCSYASPSKCQTDEDCGKGYICACAGTAYPDDATCVQADCATPSDCASGECGFSNYYNGCYQEQAIACRTASDACRSVADCAGAQACGVSSGTPGFQCLDYTCTVGRPLLVDSAPRFAPARRRSDWLADRPLPETGDLPEGVRESLAAHFTAMGAMEHASIGSFARFSLELLALGAPPALLREAHAAAEDEIVHAELAYAMATAYSGQPVGPGALNVKGVVPCDDPRDIVSALVKEACVGETVAAAEALHLAGTVVDPALSALHAQVAEDEARHAELGWRTLAWMLSERPELAAVADQAFSEAIREIGSLPKTVSDVVAPTYGLLSSAALGEVRQRAARDIVGPCRLGVMGAALAGKRASGARETSAAHLG
ncbi:MAG: ferritin-like domain-containing protein [Polyangiaceae bacterium]